MEELSPHEALPPYPGQQPRRSPLRCILPCCALVLLIGAAILVGAFAWISSSEIKEPAKITATVQEVLPGDLPPGFTPAFGSKLSLFGRTMRMGLFTHADPTKLVIAVGDFPNTPPDYIHMQVFNLARSKIKALNGQPKAIDRKSIELKVKGTTLSAQERIITLASGTKVREVFTILGVNTGVLFAGHQDTFDDAAMQAYLNAVVQTKDPAAAKTVEIKTAPAKTAKTQ